ncbi:Venom allergen 2 [Atta colombica]|uniref:Venom allergen 2 n=1 Tax=Atta colombica TaxID=520822 RepID=A0A195BLH0_9HYME|nr:PREDICTED: venom allergen 2-like [Atta colombica]KYM86548.1 Venom allergen 2 [Atta colombica]
MKTSILFMCLLTVAYVTTDLVGLKTLCYNIYECAKKLKKCGNLVIDPLTDIFVWDCALRRVNVINEKNEVIRENGIKYCEDVMLYKKNVDSCKCKVANCIDKECKNLKPIPKYNKEVYCQINCIIKEGVMSNIDCNMYNCSNK